MHEPKKRPHTKNKIMRFKMCVRLSTEMQKMLVNLLRIHIPKIMTKMYSFMGFGAMKRNEFQLKSLCVAKKNQTNESDAHGSAY